MALEALLPSEVARLVYGYLLSENCNHTAKVFLEESPNLQECRKVLTFGRNFTTKVGGLALIDILEKFCLANSIIQENISNFDDADKLKPCKDLVSQIQLLLERFQSQKSSINVGTSIQHNSVMPNESSTSWRKNSPLKTKDKIRNAAPLPNVQIPVQNQITLVHSNPSIEATPLDALPGYTNNSEIKKPEVKLKSPQSFEPHNRSHKMLNEGISPFQQFPNGFIKSPIKSSTKSYTMLEIENSNLTQCNKILDENIMADASEGRFKDLRKFEVQTPLTLPSPVTLQRELPNECVEILGDITSELLNRTEFQEKIAENINKVMHEKSDGFMSKSLESDFEKLIGTAVYMTESDPEFIEILNSVMLPDNAISDTGQAPTEMNSQYIVPEPNLNNKNVEVPEGNACKGDANVSEEKFTTHNTSEGSIKNVQSSPKEDKTNNSTSSDMNLTGCHSKIEENIYPNQPELSSNSLENKQVLDSANKSLEKPTTETENNLDNNFKVPNDPTGPNLLDKSFHDSEDFFRHNKTVTSTPLKTLTAVQNFDNYEWFSTQALPSPNLIPSKENTVASSNPFTFTAQEKIVTMTDSFLSPIVSQEMCKFAQRVTSISSTTAQREQTLNTPEVSYLPKINVPCTSVATSSTNFESKAKPPSAQKTPEELNDLLPSFHKSDVNNINLSSLLKDTKLFGHDSVNLYGQDNIISTVKTPLTVPEIEVEDSVTLTGTDLVGIVKLRKKPGETSKIEMGELSKITKSIVNGNSNEVDLPESNEKTVGKAINTQPGKTNAVDKSNENVSGTMMNEIVEKNTPATLEDKPKRKLSLSTPKKQSHIRAISFDTPINRPQSESKLNEKEVFISPESMKRSLKNLSHKSFLFQSPSQTAPDTQIKEKLIEPSTIDRNKESTRMEIKLKKNWDEELRMSIVAQPEPAKPESKKKKRKSKGEKEESEPTPRKSKKRDKLTPKKEKKGKTPKKSKKRNKDKDTPKKIKKRDKSKARDEDDIKKVGEYPDEEPEVPKTESSKSMKDPLVILLSDNMNDSDIVSENDIVKLASEESKRLKHCSSASRDATDDGIEKLLREKYSSLENDNEDKNVEGSKSNEDRVECKETDSSREKVSSVPTEPKESFVQNIADRDTIPKESESKIPVERNDNHIANLSDIEKDLELSQMDDDESFEKDSKSDVLKVENQKLNDTPENRGTIDYDKIEEQLSAIMNTPETLNSSSEKRTVIYDQVSKMEGGKIVKKKYARLKTLDTNIAKKNIQNTLLTGGQQVIINSPRKDEDSLQIPPTPKIASPSSNSWGMTLTKVVNEDTRTFQSFVATPLECPPTPNIVITPQKNEEGSGESKSPEEPDKTRIGLAPTLSEIAKKSEITQFEVIKENLHKIISPLQGVPSEVDEKLLLSESFKSLQNKLEDHDLSISSNSSSSCDSCSMSSSSDDNNSQDLLVINKEKDKEIEKEVLGETENDKKNKVEEKDKSAVKQKADAKNSPVKNTIIHKEFITNHTGVVEIIDSTTSEIITLTDSILSQAEIVIVNESSPAKVFPINKSDKELQEIIQETPAKDENQCLEEEGITDTPSNTKPNENPLNLNSKISQLMLLKEQQEQMKKSQRNSEACKPKIIKIENFSPKIVTKSTSQLIKALPYDMQLKAMEIKNENMKNQSKKSKVTFQNEETKVEPELQQLKTSNLNTDGINVQRDSRFKTTETKNVTNDFQLQSKVEEKRENIVTLPNLQSETIKMNSFENRNQMNVETTGKPHDEEKSQIIPQCNVETTKKSGRKSQINTQSKSVEKKHKHNKPPSDLHSAAMGNKSKKSKTKGPPKTTDKMYEKSEVQTNVTERNVFQVDPRLRAKDTLGVGKIQPEFQLKSIGAHYGVEFHPQTISNEKEIKLDTAKAQDEADKVQEDFLVETVEIEVVTTEAATEENGKDERPPEVMEEEEIPADTQSNIPDTGDNISDSNILRKILEKSDEEVATAIESIADIKFKESLDDDTPESVTAIAKSEILETSGSKREQAKAIEAISKSSTAETDESDGEPNLSIVISENQPIDQNLNTSGHAHYTRSKSKEPAVDLCNSLGLSNCDEPCQEFHYIFDEDTYKRTRRKTFTDESMTTAMMIDDVCVITAPTQVDMIFNINPLRRKGGRKAKLVPHEVNDVDDESRESISSKVNGNTQGTKRRRASEGPAKTKKRKKNALVL